ncbi:MAG: hypothetical protein KatS3mg008_1853 [Acidimicrobiales bacterium]|nr:MAG: hypothetical protein KatS3mg008_1853 [Acidimicrobiales bacterium]
MSRSVRIPIGAVTGVGSVPHCDPSEAVDFVLRTQSRLPAAPQLPARSPNESMLGQAIVGMRGVTLDPVGGLKVDLDEFAPAEGGDSLSSDAFVGMRAFLNAVVDRTGPVKVQLTGAVTLAVELIRAGVPPRLAFDAATKTLEVRVGEIMGVMERRLPQVGRVLVFDEPWLTALRGEGLPASPVQVLDALARILGVGSEWATVGVHCCGPTDWSLVLSAGPDLLSAPVWAGLEEAAGSLARFLDRGGWVAWGVVPTSRPIGMTSERLWRSLAAHWCSLVRGGCDPVVLRARALVTPECGLARHGLAQAEQVMAFAAVIADRLGQEAIGVRLQLGA